MKSKEADYFELFVRGAKVCEKAANMLDEMVCNLDNYCEKINAIHEVEREGDELYHELYFHLNRSFITPIDREDIMNIARNIEETIDSIDEVAIMFNMLSIDKVRPAAREMVKLIVKSSSSLVEATTEFKNFKRSKKLNDFLVELNHIEEEGDKLYQDSLKNLFSSEPNVLEVVKWKNILDTMEEVLDAAENAADVMEGVVVKNS